MLRVRFCICVLAFLMLTTFSGFAQGVLQTNFFPQPANSFQVAQDDSGNIYLVQETEVIVDVTRERPHVFFSKSVDGGVIFSKPFDITALSDALAFDTDPAILADESGTIYVSWIRGQDILLSISQDQGASFSAPIVAASKQFATTTMSGPIKMATSTVGSLFVIYAEREACANCCVRTLENHLMAITSTDSGQNFSAPVELFFPAADRYSLVADQQGRVNVLLGSYELSNPPIYLIQSVDNGANYFPAIDIAGSIPSLLPKTGEAILALNENDELLIMYGEWVAADCQQNYVLARSKNNGMTFSALGTVSGLSCNYGPALAVDSLGTVNAVWVDGVAEQVMFAFSLDQGNIFSNPISLGRTMALRDPFAVVLPQTLATLSGGSFTAWLKLEHTFASRGKILLAR